MRKFGKYEKMRKNAILRTYITSLLCLVLCVTMFFGTSMAWFSDTAESTQNQMYVGTLEIELNHASFKNGSLGDYALVEKVADVDNPIIDPAIKWEPGYTAVEKFELTEKGDLAFSYQLGIERDAFADTDKDQVAIAKAITVWNYTGANAKDTTTLPANFEELVSADWDKVGTLYDVITNKIPVFSGKMEKDAVTVQNDAEAYHMIALHMNENFDGIYQKKTDSTEELSVQGATLNGLTIKLVATQMPSEEDAFDADYDQMPADIVVVKDVKVDDNNKTTEKVVLAATSSSAVASASVEVPAGVTVKADTEKLTLTIKETDTPKVTVASGKDVLALDIEVEGLAATEAPIPVKLSIARNLTNVEVYHNGTKMATSASGNNEYFTYDAASGQLTLYVTTFSPFDVVYRDDGVVEVANSAELEAAVKGGATKILLADGEYNVANCGGKTLTISGSKNAVVKIANEGEDGCDYGFDGSTVTFNGVTIDTTSNNGNYKGYARMSATFNDCAIVGAYTTHQVQTFNNCAFDTKNGYIWIWGATEVNFNGCEFGYNSKAILAHGSASTVINIKDCNFAATEVGKTSAGDPTAAVEIDPVGSNTYTINFSGKNTKTEHYNGWTRVKDDSTGHVITGLN